MFNLCFGFISDIDPSKGLVRVEFKEETDEGGAEDGGVDKNLVSDWIPISVRKSLKDKETFPYDVNEHVWCVMDEYLERGICCGAIYSDRDAPDGAGPDIHRILFNGGSYEQFDRSSGNRENFYKGTYKVSTQNGATHEMDDKHKIANTAEDLKSIMDDFIAAIKLMTFTNGGGVTGVANNVASFDTLKTRIDNLLL